MPCRVVQMRRALVSRLRVRVLMDGVGRLCTLLCPSEDEMFFVAEIAWTAVGEAMSPRVFGNEACGVISAIALVLCW